MLSMLCKFGLVGLAGVGVNMAVYLPLLWFGIDYRAANACAFLVAVTNNFFWNMRWTFKGRAEEKSVRRKYFSFLLISLLNFGVNHLVLRILVEYFFVGKILAQFGAIALVSASNFLLNYLITFADRPAKGRKETAAVYESGCNTNL